MIISRKEVDDLLRYMEQFPTENLFHIKTTHTGAGRKLEVRHDFPKPVEPIWMDISDYDRW